MITLCTDKAKRKMGKVTFNLFLKILIIQKNLCKQKLFRPLPSICHRNLYDGEFSSWRKSFLSPYIMSARSGEAWEGKTQQARLFIQTLSHLSPQCVRDDIVPSALFFPPVYSVPVLDVSETISQRPSTLECLNKRGRFFMKDFFRDFADKLCLSLMSVYFMYSDIINIGCANAFVYFFTQR